MGPQIVLIMLVVSGLFVAWSTGTNDAANCIGVPVGANIISFKRAVLLMAIFVFLGAMLQGQNVMETTGSGIVITTTTTYEEYHQTSAPSSIMADMDSFFPEERMSDLAMMVALFAAGISVVVATYSGIPLSASQSIVASVAGAGIGIVGMQPDFFRYEVLLRIFGSWIISPLLTLAIAFLSYYILSKIGQRVKDVLKWERTLASLVIASSCYFAFAQGANAFGAGLGPLTVRFPEMITIIAAVGGIMVGLGALTFGHKVTKAVGKDITQLDYAGALAAQFAAGMGLLVFANMGIPVSSSQAIVGAVVGVGLVKGAAMINKKKIIRICAGWVITPIFAGGLAVGLYKMLAFVL